MWPVLKTKSGRVTEELFIHAEPNQETTVELLPTKWMLGAYVSFAIGRSTQPGNSLCSRRYNNSWRIHNGQADFTRFLWHLITITGSSSTVFIIFYSHVRVRQNSIYIHIYIPLSFHFFTCYFEHSLLSPPLTTGSSENANCVVSFKEDFFFFSTEEKLFVSSGTSNRTRLLWPQRVHSATRIQSW